MVTILQTEGETLFRWVSYFRPVSWPRWGYFKGEKMKNWLGISLIIIGIIGAIICVILSYIYTRVLYWQLFIASIPYIIGSFISMIIVFVGIILKDA